jgi:ribosomal protein L37E
MYVFLKNKKMVKCKVENCTVKQPNFNYKGQKLGIYCGTHKLIGMKNVKKPTCKEETCNISPCFNFPGETKGIYCATHKLLKMVNVKDITCEDPDCSTIPNFNFSGEIKGIYCVIHKLPDMVDVKNKKCQDSSCDTSANYNFQGNKKGVFCSIHKLDDMINVTEKKCICGIRASFNFLGKKSMYCAQHKLKGMICVSFQIICKSEDCNIGASFNFSTEREMIYCKKHKLPDMINIKNKRFCQIETCNIQPCFNFPIEKIPILCASHKEELMVDIVNKKCLHENCQINPNYNYQNESKGIYCFTHKLDTMVDVTHKKCLICGLRAHDKYTGYCFRCYIYTFPNNKISRNYKIKEQHMVDFIQKIYSDTVFIFDKTTGGCSRRRPDVYIDLFTHVLIIECDENQHGSYTTSCENSRTMELFQDFNNRPIVFIRFNPDTYTQNGKKSLSSFKTHGLNGAPIIRNKGEWNGRLDLLKNTIDKHLQTIPTKEITIENLFFDF